MISRSENGAAGLNGKPKNNSNHGNGHHEFSPSPVIFLLQKATFYAFGILNWLLFLFLALKSGALFKKPSEKEANLRAIARDAFWNLSNQPLPGFHHDFFRTRNGFQLHYISNQQEPTVGDNLFIFIHGFPNTCMIWRHLFQEPSLSTGNATLVAVDLPGYGGSDSLLKYDTQVLEYLTEFIIAMREKHGTIGDSVGSTFIVGHDWGCSISMRLASEAPCLADRFIFMNGVLVDLTKANVGRSMISAKQIFKQFQAAPRANFGCLKKSFNAAQPLLRQLMYSGYMFVFQLPSVFVKNLSEWGDQAFLRACYKAEHSASKDDYRPAEAMATNLGPSTTECRTRTRTGLTYGSLVEQRAHSTGEVFWHATAYYRNGLALDHWEKSIETIGALYNIDSDMSSSQSPSRRRSSSAASPLFSDHFKGSLHAPATVLWGDRDLALTRSMCLDGIGDYLARGSEVFVFPYGSHWLQVDMKSRGVLAQIIAIFASGNVKQTPIYLAKQIHELDGSVSLLVKR